ncbi:hypothetical protein EDC01DRAFT_634064 [Geopyxis carbonaria]|nr:hypothetical protein EDC01DRAFT_634064 [Geopyxis carbonaria]
MAYNTPSRALILPHHAHNSHHGNGSTEIRLDWRTSPITYLAASTLAIHLPSLLPHIRRAHPDHLDVTIRLASLPLSLSDYRKAATVILRFFARDLDGTAPFPPQHPHYPHYPSHNHPYLYAPHNHHAPHHDETEALPEFLARKAAASTDAHSAFHRVVAVADAFGCIPAIRPHVEHTLLTFARPLARSGVDLAAWMQVLMRLESSSEVRRAVEGAFRGRGGEMVLRGRMGEQADSEEWDEEWEEWDEEGEGGRRGRRRGGVGAGTVIRDHVVALVRPGGRRDVLEGRPLVVVEVGRDSEEDRIWAEDEKRGRRRGHGRRGLEWEGGRGRRGPAYQY